MNLTELRSLTLGARAPGYHLILSADGVLLLANPDGTPAIGADGAEIYRVRTPTRGMSATIATVLHPTAGDADHIRNALGVRFNKGGMEGDPMQQRMSIEAGIRMLRAVDGSKVFTAADVKALMESDVDALGPKLCAAALAVYNEAANAGNVSASPKSEAITTGGSSTGSPETSAA